MNKSIPLTLLLTLTTTVAFGGVFTNPDMAPQGYGPEGGVNPWMASRVDGDYGPDFIGAGWFRTSGYVTSPSNAPGEYVRPNTAGDDGANYHQVVSNGYAATEGQVLKYEFSLLDIGDLTDPALHIELWGSDVFVGNGNYSDRWQPDEGSAGGDTWSAITSIVVDLTAVSVDTEYSHAVDFGAAGHEAVAINAYFLASADGGNEDNLTVSMLDVVPIPEPTGLLLLCLIAPAWYYRK